MIPGGPGVRVTPPRWLHPGTPVWGLAVRSAAVAEPEGGATMKRVRVGLLVLTGLVLGLAAGPPAVGAQSFTPGAAGVDDPYFPLEGNGGYDVQHYDLEFSYNPATDRLDATNKVTARATQDLSRLISISSSWT